MAHHFQFEASKDTEQGATIQDKNPKGHLFVPFNSNPASNPDLLRKRTQLSEAIAMNQALAVAVNTLLNKQIDREGWLAFESESIFDVPPASSLKFYKKIELIARYRLLTRSTSSPKHGTRPEVKEGFLEMYLVRVTEKGTLVVEDFVAPSSPERGVGYFHYVLSDPAAPYHTMGRYLSHAIFGGYTVFEETDIWSYRLVDRPSKSRHPKVAVHLDWSPVNTEEQYDEMLASVKDTGRSVILIRVSRQAKSGRESWRKKKKRERETEKERKTKLT
ncbi:hypothetical protein F4779DRAFT_348646 [Xylariaceae sp. FL0662B]|nr:hypothetical protein F4779DRAFT_348646 [Xylariaceae sp. FL0662B]